MPIQAEFPDGSERSLLRTLYFLLLFLSNSLLQNVLYHLVVNVTACLCLHSCRNMLWVELCLCIFSVYVVKLTFLVYCVAALHNSNFLICLYMVLPLSVKCFPPGRETFIDLERIHGLCVCDRVFLSGKHNACGKHQR